MVWQGCQANEGSLWRSEREKETEEADMRLYKQCSWSETCSEREGNVNRMHCCRTAYVSDSGLCSVYFTLRGQSDGTLSCPRQNHWPLPSEAIKQHLMPVREVVKLHYSESLITFTARDESHSDWKVIATLLLNDDSCGKKIGWSTNNWHFGFDMLLRKEEEETHNEEEGLKACNDSGHRTQRRSGGG